MGGSRSHELVLAIKALAAQLDRVPTRGEFEANVKGGHYALGQLGGYTALVKAAGLESYDDRRAREACEVTKPKVLFCDIETLPLEVYTWGTFDQSVGLNQIKSDWTVLSWCAKWQDSDKVFYEDVRKEKNLRDDKRILRGIWDLLNQADIVVWHYGSAFDHKKLNARFILNGFRPPKPYKQYDTKRVASKHFGFTSNKLEYLTEKLNKKYHKSKHKQFEGFSLWRECMARNLAAFREMEKYNRMDVLSLEELYTTLSAWEQKHDFNVYHDAFHVICNCGSSDLKREGFRYTNTGKFQQYSCNKCGAWMSDKNNMLIKEKRKSLFKK